MTPRPTPGDLRPSILPTAPVAAPVTPVDAQRAALKSARATVAGQGKAIRRLTAQLKASEAERDQLLRGVGRYRSAWSSARHRAAKATGTLDGLTSDRSRLGATVLRVENLRDLWRGYALDGPQVARLLAELDEALRPAVVCAATFAYNPFGTGARVIRCSLPVGHYDGARRPALDGDDPAGWHRNTPSAETGTVSWADGADGATPHTGPAAAVETQPGGADGHEACRTVQVDGQPVRLAGGSGELTEKDRWALGEVIAAVKRKYAAEHTDGGETEQRPFATDAELKVRQRYAWRAAGCCTRCGSSGTGGWLCASCGAEVRTMRAGERRIWRRWERPFRGAPIQGSGYSPAQLIGGLAPEAAPAEEPQDDR